jgi:hypothetical protein
MTDNRPRALPMLAGIVFVAISFAAFAIGGETPSIDDSAQKVADFYADNKTKEYVASFLLLFAIPFAAIFVAHLHHLLKWASPRRVWAKLALIGGAAIVPGWAAAGAVHLALTEAADKKLPPDALRALNALDADFWPLLAIPMMLLMLGSGAAILGSTTLPRALGWIALIAGIIGFSPAGFFMFIVAGLWVIAISIVGYSRLAAAERDAPPGAGGAGPETPLAA